MIRRRTTIRPRSHQLPAPLPRLGRVTAESNKVRPDGKPPHRFGPSDCDPLQPQKAISLSSGFLFLQPPDRDEEIKMVRQGKGGREEEIMGSRCQDCGNQSKKECVYMRCRTCCKSKRFHCQTHFKSTWVPVYRRRGTHHQQLPSIDPQNPRPHLHQGHNYNPRRTAAGHVITNPPSSGQNQQVNNFPAEVNSMANFRCVRVSSVGETVNQQAYQTSTVIGGHVFKAAADHQVPHHHQLPSSYPLIPFNTFMPSRSKKNKKKKKRSDGASQKKSKRKKK